MPFKDVKYLNEFDLKLPDFLASWDVWEYWENERIHSMHAHLSSSDVLFEVGAESGWMTALFGKYFVDPKNVCIFEPTPEYWPNIKQTWEANCTAPPRIGVCALVGNENKNAPTISTASWPKEAYGDLTQARSYKYIHEHGETTPQIRLDDFVQLSGIIPNALTIDVEGAECDVIAGAELILKTFRPLVWCSVHPDLIERDYKRPASDVSFLMDSFGYVGKILAQDHETHFLYRPK